MIKVNVAIVGGGASGFFAAIIAKSKNPNANVLIIEPIDGVVDRFKELIDCQVSYDYDLPRNGGVVISDKTSLLNKANWDLVVFDEFHKMDKDL